MAPNNSNSDSGVPMDRTTLRSYRPGDWQAMYALDLICFAPVFQFNRGAMRSFAETPGAVTLLTESEGKLAGFCIAQLEDRTGYVVTLDVAPEWRRRGLARRLMAAVESKLHAAGAMETQLHVFTGNSAAIHFYESIGYERVGMAENFYAQNMHALIYRKKFDA